MFLAEIWKKKKKKKKKKKIEFLSEKFQFLVVKFSVYLNRRVFVMKLDRVFSLKVPLTPFKSIHTLTTDDKNCNKNLFLAGQAADL